MNEKVSQLVELTAIEIAPDDLFFIADMSSRESKKLTSSGLLTFVNVSASIYAANAVLADTASYVAGSDVHGIVASATTSDTSVSASHALRANNADTASFALTATFIGTVNTASFLQYSGVPNGTASFALTASLAQSVLTASFLQYSGVPNGTASFAITSSRAITASLALSANTVVSASYSDTASFVKSAKSASFIDQSFLLTRGPIKAWAQVTWSVDSASLKITDKYNISSIVSVDSFTNGTYDPLTFNLPVTYSQFAVTFTNAVPQPNYILIGSGVKLYGLGSNDKADVMIHPVYGNRTTSSFTMSVVTQGPNNFYTEVSASYSSGRTGYVTFQILSDY